jgi:hypothetical protein
MKPFRKIIILTTIVCAIVMLWLLPLINKAHYTRYTRVYENTDVPKETETSDTLTVYLPEAKPVKKVYLKQSIEDDAKLSEIDAEMYSRALHFEEEEMIPDELLLVETDSTSDQNQLTLYDSLQYASVDTLNMAR